MSNFVFQQVPEQWKGQNQRQTSSDLYPEEQKSENHKIASKLKNVLLFQFPQGQAMDGQGK